MGDREFLPESVGRQCTVGVMTHVENELDRVAGPWMEIGTVAEKLGVTAAEVERLVHEGSIWALRTSDEYSLMPERQFTTSESFGLLPGASDVMQAMIQSRGPGRDDNQAMLWLFWPRADRDGQSAFELIRDGRTAEVVEVVERLLRLGS
jgi:hypothetical protein